MRPPRPARTVRVLGVSIAGAEAEIVTVEARCEAADPMGSMGRKRLEVVLSGLPDAVLRESKNRLVSALDELGLGGRDRRLFLNLVPAGLRKSGEILDLPMALAAAAAFGHLAPRALQGTVFLGEVGIDGRLHAVPGGLAAADAARRAGLACIVGPAATAGEAACLPGIEAWRADNLADVVAWAARGGSGLAPAEPPPASTPNVAAAVELDSIRGQAEAKRALAIAAVGGHGLLFVGPPGTGKSLLARAFVALLPPPDPEERLAITRILSATGRWPGGLVATRPFRAPHHTTSYAGLVGGGSPPQPGEITLAHAGVLFLDELAEFRREALEALRQPLEEGRITIARAGRRLDLPARFALVCAMNPCPCGYRGHHRVRCRCSPAEVWRYRRRISGPLLDRIDLRLELPAPGLDELAAAPRGGDGGGEGEAVRRSILDAHERTRERRDAPPNARLEADALDRLAPLGPRERRLLEEAVDQRGLSARAVQSLRRVARSIADLDGVERVDASHLAQALALRAPLL